MKYSAEDRMQLLLNAPEAVEVLERYYPKILKNPALQMTRCMSLRAVAAFAQSFLSMKRKRWMEVVGLVLAVALMGLALVVAFGLTPQTIVPLVAVFVILLAVMV